MRGEAGRKAIRGANFAVNAVVVAILLGFLTIGCYALWDSHQVSTAASASQWQPYKPAQGNTLSFGELRKINPDVKAWLQVYGTGIDYPVVQGKDNDTYLSKNAKGEEALSGSIFLEARNKSDFTSFPSIVYGHHMEDHLMFGDLDEFDAKDFFDEHQYGNLFYDGRDWGVEFFGFLEADAYDGNIYRTNVDGQAAKQEWLSYVESKLKYRRTSVSVDTDSRVLMLSTCASEKTNGRWVLLGKITDETYKNPYVKWPNTGTGVDGFKGWFGIPWYDWLLIALAVTLGIVLYVTKRKRRQEETPAEDGDHSPDESVPPISHFADIPPATGT